MANKLFKALPKLKNPNTATKPIKLKTSGNGKIPQIKFPKLSGMKAPSKVSGFKLPGVKNIGLGKVSPTKNSMLKNLLSKLQKLNN